MPYVIFEIVYGIPLTSDDKLLSTELKDIVDSEEHVLIQSRYSGFATQDPAFCGVSLGEFDECEPVIEISKPNIIDEFNSAFNQMPAEVQQMIRDYGGEPRVFLLAFTS